MVNPGAYLRGDLVRHLGQDMVGASRGSVLATFLDVHNEPVAAVAWHNGSVSITALRYLDRIAHDFKPARSFL